jgi:NADH-quinone oxidoreductase subunit F
METKILTKYWNDPAHAQLETYVEHGGYKGLKQCLDMAPERVIEEVKKSKLRGRGGAGFPCGTKWSFIPKNSTQPKYIICNADESEPGTFKDRAIFWRDPHSMLEGIAIAAWAVQANTAYIYIRGEFVEEAKLLKKAIEQAYSTGYLGKSICGSDLDLEVYLHRGAGAYICGEETGLLESLEGRKGQPRNKPPFPASNGLFQCPTVINNVETLATIPWIINNGGDAYAQMGTAQSSGTKLCGVSGPVKKPGIYEVEMGYPMMQLLDELAGGMLDGKQLRAVIPGGSSTPPITAEEAKIAQISYESLDKLGSALGTAGMIVLPKDFSVIKAMAVISRFYADESCGQCTPCREGTGWLNKLMWRINAGNGQPRDLKALEYISQNMRGRTICALADAAAWPMLGFLRIFREEFEQAVRPQSQNLSSNKREESLDG